MKIAMIHRDLPTNNFDRGGVAYHVHYLANNLVKQGHQVTIFSLDAKPKDAEYEVHQIKVNDRFRNSKLFQMYIFPVLVAQQDFSKFDIIHAHGDSQFLFTKKPVIRTFYGSSIAEALSAKSIKRRFAQLSIYPFEFLCGLLANKSIAISYATTKHLPFIKTIIPCGVDLDKFKPGKKSKKPSILFVGMIGGRKRGKLLVDVFNTQIKDKIKDAQLWLVSKEKVQGDDIRWFGKVSTKKLIELYQKAWVFCLPSSYEAFGIPYIEAMACGTPVVSTYNLGAMEVLQNGKYGLICNEKELGNNLIKLFQNETLRQNLANKGLEIVKKYSWQNIVHLYEDIYTLYYKQKIEENHHDKLAKKCINTINWKVHPDDINQYTAFVLKLFGNIKGKKILDCGCGNGYYSVLFALCGAKVFAFDISLKWVEITKQRTIANKVEDKINIKKQACEKLDYSDEQFDFVFGSLILHHVDIDLAGKEIFRVLKKAGKAVFIENSANNPLLMIARKILSGRFGIPKYGSPTEHPLRAREIKKFGRYFNKTEVHYIDFIFFKKLDAYIFKFKNKLISKFLLGLDNAIAKYLPFLKKYGARQIVVFTK